ncbi:uncharacterized protein LOC114524718 isoform X2 [Dendronephthya gigantea]|uniref:uncharacterized protein LOC114524718 isoform X2 n=1 Tax=Dendronephthya gigantea TaxID=151771 RepID=UPI00106C4152|nr:uncharacterized protein LOC114524718 isoform X2 [Dendronephthya gigantea]
MKGILTVAGGAFIHVALGILFTFGNINLYITSYLRFRSSSVSVEYSDSMLIMGCIQISMHIALMFGGVIELKLGARITSFLGGLLLSLGLVMTYFTARHSFAATSVSYGLTFGLGIGIGYSSSLGRAMQWYPNNKGLVGGLVIGGSGVAAIMFSALETGYTNPNNLVPNVTIEPNNDKFFGEAEVLDRVPYLFLLLGVVCFALCSIGAMLLFEPPPVNVMEETKEGRTLFQELTHIDDFTEEDGLFENEIDAPGDIPPLQIIKKKQFWILWFLSLVNGEAVIFITTFYKIGLIIQNGIMLFLLLTFTLSEKAGKWMYFIWVVTMFTTMAGTTTYLTAATAATFGLKYFATNYGLVSSSMIPGGILGSILSQYLSDLIGWWGIFTLVAGFSCLGIGLSFLYDSKVGKPSFD